MSRISALILSLFLLINPIQYSSAEGYEKMTDLKSSLYVLFNKNAITSEYHKGEESTDIFDESAPFSMDETVTVKKEKGRDFKILTLADIHYEDYGYRAFNSIFNDMKIRRLVKLTQPDLIILPGDIVCGESDYYSIQRITDMMESFGVPWAPVFGNHDDEANCDQNFLADTMIKSPHCLMRKGDSRMGVGNYIINVAEEDSDGKMKTVECIFMMDSHHSQPNELQQKWFSRAAKGINELTGGTAEISLFMHIPLPEYQTAYEMVQNGELSMGGELHETVCCEHDENGAPLQRGFFDIIKETGTAKYVFCGHDHRNDFSVEYDGVRLTYLMKLGLSSGFQPFFDGGSVITIGNNGISRITHKTSVLGIMKDALDIKI